MISNKLSSKNAILGIVLLVLVAIGSMLYFSSSKKSPEIVSQIKTDRPATSKTPATAENTKPNLNPDISKPTPTTIVTPSPEDLAKIDTSNWKTYTNKDYGYEIKYPSDWYLYSDDISDVSIQPNKEVSGGVPGPHADAFEIKVTSVGNGKSLSEIAKAGYDQAGINFIKKSVMIAKIEGLETTSDCDGVGCGAPEWFVVMDNKLYDFKSNLGYSMTFDKILSTFGFVK